MADIEKKKNEDTKNKGVKEIESYLNDLDFNNNLSKLEEQHYVGNIEYVELYRIIDAPKEWNKFNSLSEEKKIEVKNSIKRIGLLHPLILWDNGEGKTEGLYTCISGHNRLAIYKELMKENQEKYSKIPAIIKGKDEIDENIAQEIIIDLNIAQRDISTIEKSRAIIKKFSLLKKRSDKNSEKTFTEILEEEFGISGRQIRSYKKLAELIEEFQTMIDEDIITMTTGGHIARLNKNQQSDLLDLVSNNEEYLKLLKKKSKKFKEDNNLTKEDIENILISDDEKGTITFDFLDEENKKAKAKLIYNKKDIERIKELLEFMSANEKINKYTIK